MNITMQSNRVFEPLHQSRQRYLVLKGSAGSGKSLDAAQMYIPRLLGEPGRNLLCMRKSEVSNRDSTFAELTGAIHRMELSKLFRISHNPLTITCANGNMILFRGMNDARQLERLKSIAFARGKLTDVWLEEATEFRQEEFEIIDDRLRGHLPDGQFYQIKMTFNPVNKNHWIKRAFFDLTDPNVLTHHSTYLDNRFIDDAYKARMERRKLVDPEGYQVYGLGEWGEVAGLILTNWTMREISQNTEDYDSIAIGQDFGFNHANAILLLGQRDGDIYILREVYVHEKDTSEIIEIAGEIPQDKPMHCDSAEPDRIKMWRRAGWRAKPVEKEKGSVKAQIDWLKQRHIFVHSSCQNTIKELQQWKWQKDKQTDEYLDQPVEFQDDAMAALRYGIEDWRKPVKPWLY